MNDKMSAEQKQFLAALMGRPEDPTLRNVYADWLEEHDQPEEARRQRAYLESLAWLREFTRSFNYRRYDDNDKLIPDSDDGPHDLAYVIEQGHKAVRGDSMGFGSDQGADYFRAGTANCLEFFKHWSVVTGVAVSEDVAVAARHHVRCAC